MCAMARSHVATFRGHPADTMVARPTLQRSTVATVAAAAAVAAAAVAALAGPARAVPARTVQHSAIQPGASLALTVNSVNPGYEQTDRGVTISGSVRNLTGSAMSTLSVGVRSATTPLNSTAAVDEFATGTSFPPLLLRTVTGVKPFPIATLAAHAVTRWAVLVPAKALGLSCFGVYPLTIQVSDALGAPQASYAVPLPFWPKNPHGCATGPRPQPAGISWIWPLIDSPHQGPCPGVLLDNTLAASIRKGGRLHDLLATASQYGASAQLTFAIDPALLDSLTVMRQPYRVGRAASCGHTTQYPASLAAAAWLKGLARATAKQAVFVTPYADVDIAALIRHGAATEADLNEAVREGDQIAHRVLSRDPSPVSLPAGSSKLAAVAWPAGGIASGPVLEYLAATQLKIKTVILAQPGAPQSAPRAAVAKVTTESGLLVNELRADDSITALLRRRAVDSRQRGAISRVNQLFLALTAVNVATSPSPIVVTPPRRWNPSESLANDLLTDTAAPWLKPGNIGQLSKRAPQRATGAASHSRRGAELSGRLLDKVKALDGKVGLLESIFASPDPTLRRAVFGIESSSWRSRGGTKRALVALARTAQYVSDQFSRLSLGGNRYVTLGGRSGSVIVSVRNGLSYPINVVLRVKVTDIDGSVSVSLPSAPILVQPGKVSEEKLPVHASQGGSALLHFSLASPTHGLLPRGRLTMQIGASNFGRIALIICGVALAVFVFASAARAIRSRPTPTSAGPEELPTGSPGGAGVAADPQDASDVGSEPGSVMLDQPGLTPAGQVPADPIGSPGEGRAEESQ